MRATNRIVKYELEVSMESIIFTNPATTNVNQFKMRKLVSTFSRLGTRQNQSQSGRDLFHCQRHSP